MIIEGPVSLFIGQNQDTTFILWGDTHVPAKTCSWWKQFKAGSKVKIEDWFETLFDTNPSAQVFIEASPEQLSTQMNPNAMHSPFILERVRAKLANISQRKVTIHATDLRVPDERKPGAYNLFQRCWAAQDRNRIYLSGFEHIMYLMATKQLKSKFKPLVDMLQSEDSLLSVICQLTGLETRRKASSETQKNCQLLQLLLGRTKMRSNSAEKRLAQAIKQCRVGKELIEFIKQKWMIQVEQVCKRVRSLYQRIEHVLLVSAIPKPEIEHFVRSRPFENDMYLLTLPLFDAYTLASMFPKADRKHNTVEPKYIVGYFGDYHCQNQIEFLTTVMNVQPIDHVKREDGNHCVQTKSPLLNL